MDAKKKRDKGNGDSGAKAANTHVLAESTASIEEVNEMAVSLCAVTKLH